MRAARFVLAVALVCARTDASGAVINVSLGAEIAPHVTTLTITGEGLIGSAAAVYLCQRGGRRSREVSSLVARRSAEGLLMFSADGTWR
jgi:hypothetical protein